MRRLWFSLIVIGLLLAIAAPAADITGKWTATFTSPDGQERTNSFTFKVDGGKLTGSISGGQDETPIQNAKISGDDISFTAERPFGAFTYAGKISGDEIHFKVEFNGQSFEMTAKRAR
jgi:hypothetical protein